MPNNLDDIIKIALVGPPLGGKGSLVKGLKEVFDFDDSQMQTHDDNSSSQKERAMVLPIGNIFSKHTQDMTPLGKAVFPYTSKRELVPDEYTNAVVQEAFEGIISRNDESNDTVNNYRIVLNDGYPRNVSQYYFAKERGYITMAAIIDVPDNLCFDRSFTRFIHPLTKEPYSSKDSAVIVTEWREIDFNDKKYNIPISAQLTDGTILTKRADDSDINLVLKGIENYHHHTIPLVHQLCHGLSEGQSGINNEGVHIVKLDGVMPPKQMVTQFLDYLNIHVLKR